MIFDECEQPACILLPLITKATTFRALLTRMSRLTSTLDTGTTTRTYTGPPSCCPHLPKMRWQRARLSRTNLPRFCAFLFQSFVSVSNWVYIFCQPARNGFATNARNSEENVLCCVVLTTTKSQPTPLESSNHRSLPLLGQSSSHFSQLSDLRHPKSVPAAAPACKRLCI